MSIRLPGLPSGVQAERICAGNMVGEDEYELFGSTIRKGGRVAKSAVVVTIKDGYELVPWLGNFKVKKKG